MTRLEYPDVPVHALMQAQALRSPQRAAIVFGARTMTFRELDEESSRLAHGFRSLGVDSGDRIGIYVPNCPEYECAFYAASKLGAVVTPLNPSYTTREITYQLNDVGAKLLITHERLWPVVSAVCNQLATVTAIVVIGDVPQALPDEVYSYEQVIDGQPATTPAGAITPDQLIALPFSSGTTGLPKGVMLTHRNLVCNHLQFCEAAGLSERDVYIVYLPLSHIYGIALMGLALCAGASQILIERFDLQMVNRLAGDHNVTLLHVVPPVLLALANAPDLDIERFRSLRYILNAAAPLAPDVARRVEQRLSVPVIQAYGMTEASPDTHHSPIARERMRLESVGTLVADTEHKIVDLDDETTVLGPGQLGEVVVRGPQVMQGYWNAPRETARALRDAWLHTGDIGYVDADGYLFIVDRKKEMIKCNSFSIAPADLESVVLQHPGVADCGVIGMPDAECGEVPKAFVVARDGRALDLGALEAFVTERVAGYKRIRLFEPIEAIPRTPSGKILRRLLKQPAAPV